MKNRKIIYLSSTLLMSFIILFMTGCEREVSDDVDFASFSNNPNVFIDGFSAGLEYFPFGGSKLDAFSVDSEVKYKGSASMRFDVPNFGDPSGSFAGAIFPDMGGRDLSEYDALTFWAKATKAGTINEIGFGNDFGENKYLVTRQNLRISTTWTKYTIPLPDPQKLITEKGMFWYAEGPEDGDGYSFWIDELKFEKLGTVAQPRPAIYGGADIEGEAFINIQGKIPDAGLTQTFNLASGVNETVIAAPSYFTFKSSDTDVVIVSELGVLTPIGLGTTEITATLGGVRAAGSVTLEVKGGFEFAPEPPVRDPGSVISIFSDAYTNVPVDFYNGFFAPFQTTLGGAVEINEGESIIVYEELNFVATEFKNPTVNATAMTHFHADIKIDETIDSGDFIAVELGDFGPNAAFGGDDDSSSRITFDSSALVSGEWISLDIPLSDFTDLTSRSNLAQIFFISDATISTLLVDNMYFYTE
ncbi:MAG: glycosyl hydrolase family 16 [Muriicola sp.]|nr:glycosyl hydrolase family 16 [Muriicola sp.]NNK10238.1 glycosyl hydrolase family 16 [Flavobacteriaceae bacterium]NNK36211.1 glycosyl hydrolase family 16 [Eudoraea sp.]